MSSLIAMVGTYVIDLSINQDHIVQTIIKLSICCR